MGNTLTNLIPSFYVALDKVSRELTGLIPAVTRDSGVERAAIGQTVYSHVAPASTATDITPGVTAPNTGDQTIGNVALQITKSRMVPIRWNGEDSLGINNGGPGVERIMADQFAQGIRTLVNEMETDLAALQAGFSRAYGTPTTTPFGTAGDFTDASNAMKILKDNGAPGSDNHLIINTAAGAKMIGLQSRYDVAGGVDMQRQGIILNTAGFDVRESNAILTFTKGTGASATTDNAGYAVGATVLTLASAGTGTLLAGDVVTFAGDTNQYVLASGDTDTSNGGTITLAAPGLRVAMSAATKAITVVGTSARNMAFNRSAIMLATRAPALPPGGDSAKDRFVISDPITNLTFEVSVYAQYRQVHYELAAAWGTKLIKPEHTSLLLG